MPGSRVCQPILQNNLLPSFPGGHQSTPVGFAALLQNAKEYVSSHSGQPKLITINAWNEWVEGSYLFPDIINGYGYLDAMRRVMSGGEYDKC